MIRLARASLTIVIACAIGTPAEAALDVPAVLENIAQASVATVVLVPPMAVFQGSLTSSGLQNNGCHYTTADAAAIRALVVLVQGAQVAANAVYQRPDIREGLYFGLADGSRFSLLIADNNGGRLPVMGIAESSAGGQILSASVSAKSTLAIDVRAWARRHGGAGTGTACDLQTGIAEDPNAPSPVPR